MRSQVKNNGQTPDRVRAALQKLPKGSERRAKIEAQLNRMIKNRSPEEQKPVFVVVDGGMGQLYGPDVYAAWRDGAPFFPVFVLNYCDGCNASSREAEKLSELFQAPVLSFSSFDSDVAFASWCDTATGERADIARAPAGYEEYDQELYQDAFPEFLLPFFPSEAKEDLERIWGERYYLFAEDRVYDTMKLLGVPVLFGDDPNLGMNLEGWTILKADESPAGA